MRLTTRVLKQAVASGALALGLATAAWGQAWPSRPVTVVIPFAAGGTTDNEARLYTQKLQEFTGQPFVFDFKPGAGTSIGLAFVAKAAPDGYTLVMINSGLTVHPHFYPSLPYDVMKSFAPISLMSNRATGLMINAAALPNVRSLADLVGHARANPGALSCNTAGAGSITHIVCAALAADTKTDIVPVHYKGVSQGQTDLLAGRTQVQAGTIFNYQAMIKSGKLRLIAVLTEERSPLMPDVRTAAEQGVNVDFPSWLGVLGPAGLPQPVIARLHAELVKAVRSPEVSRQLEAGGSTPVGSTPEAFRARMARELAQWKKIVQENNIKGEG